MISRTRHHWPEYLLFGGLFGVLLLLAAPDMTWINTDADGPHYVYSAKYLYPAHKTSAPLFLLLGHLFLKIPFGTEFWRMALMSVMASTASGVLVYLIIRLRVNSRLYGSIGALIFGSSALIISQSTIVESYALVTMFGLSAYYFSLKRKWLFVALSLGAGGAVHHLIGIPIIVLLIAHRELRSWRYLGVMGCFLLFYLYIPLTSREPDMWGNQGGNFFRDNLSTAWMLIGGLAIWELPKRILDSAGLLVASLWLAVIPLTYWIWKKRTWKEPLLWLFLLPIIYYILDLAPQTYVYMMPAVAFGAVLAGIGLSRMRLSWTYATVLVALCALGFNIWYFDIGRTLDSDLAARQYYDNELPKVPDGEILLAQQGWEWAIIYLYNRQENRDIIPACVGSLPSPIYQDQLRDRGVMLVDDEEARISVRPTNIALSIIELNENVWTTVPTEPGVYGTEIVIAKGNEDKLLYSPISITDGSVDGVWKFSPSNPYDIITGAIEVNEWVFIVYSNYTVLTFIMLGTIGAVPCWILYMIFIRKKKWSLRKEVQAHAEAAAEIQQD